MGKKQNNIKSGAAEDHKQQLRDEAIARDSARRKRSTEEQLALIAKRPGNSAKEKAKLMDS